MYVYKWLEKLVAKTSVYKHAFVLHLGMMIESMAGKSASLLGLCLNATPFTFSEDIPAVEYYGNLLVKGWYMIDYIY